MQESDCEKLDELVPLSIPCLAVFCFEAKTINLVTFAGTPPGTGRGVTYSE